MVNTTLYRCSYLLTRRWRDLTHSMVLLERKRKTEIVVEWFLAREVFEGEMEMKNVSIISVKKKIEIFVAF